MQVPAERRAGQTGRHRSSPYPRFDQTWMYLLGAGPDDELRLREVELRGSSPMTSSASLKKLRAQILEYRRTQRDQRKLLLKPSRSSGTWRSPSREAWWTSAPRWAGRGPPSMRLTSGSTGWAGCRTTGMWTAWTRCYDRQRPGGGVELRADRLADHRGGVRERSARAIRLPRRGVQDAQW